MFGGSSRDTKLMLQKQESEIQSLREQIEHLKRVASFSYEEAMIGIKNGEVVFKNTAAQNSPDIDQIAT